MHPATKSAKIFLALSAAVFIFYLCTQVLLSNVYRYAVVGALFEMLSLPLLALQVALPVVTIVQWVRYPKAIGAYSFLSLILLGSALYLLLER